MAICILAADALLGPAYDFILMGAAFLSQLYLVYLLQLHSDRFDANARWIEEKVASPKTGTLWNRKGALL